MTSRSTQTSLAELIRELRGLGAIRRDLQHHAAVEGIRGGITALATIDRLGAANVSAVADELQVDLSVASRQLSALSREGLIERTSDPLDGRARLVRLTDGGEKALGAAQRRASEAIGNAVADWDSEEVARLAKSLRRLRSDYLLATRAGDDSPEQRPHE